MPIVPVTQPQPVTPGGGFDYVAVDGARGRVYAAHGGGGGLLIADSATGKEIGIVKVGPMAGVAVDFKILFGKSRIIPHTAFRFLVRRLRRYEVLFPKI